MSDISKENLMYTLPSVLADDKRMNALAVAAAEALEDRVDEINLLAFYKRIDSLPEDLLDILAYDFKIDWWNAKLTVEEKRKILKSNWHIHKMMGTKAAVETALSDVYDGTTVKEWFEYSGQPYHFKINIDSTYQNVDPVKHNLVIQKVRLYKNARSVLDDVEYSEKSCEATSWHHTAIYSYSITDGATAS